MTNLKVKNKKIPLLILLIPILGLAITVRTFSQGFSAVDDELGSTISGPVSLDAAATELAETNCRYGVAYLPDAWLSAAWLKTLRAGWFLNFSPYVYPEPSSEFVFTIRVRQVIAPGYIRLPEYTVFPPLTDYYDDNGSPMPGLGHYLANYPGATWLVGNEIDIDNPRQDNIMPDLYAEAYYNVYHYIKSVDPTAQVGIGSVLQATPGRLQYLDIVWDTYQSLFGKPLPVDIWNIHIYILPERTRRAELQYADGKVALGTDPNLAKFSTRDPLECPAPGLPDTPENDPKPNTYCVAEHLSMRIFQEQVVSLRQWMKEKGLQNKPLIISEYGSLKPYRYLADGTCYRPDEFGNCFPPPRVNEFLLASTEYMENAVDPEIGYPEDGNRLVQRWLWYSIYSPYMIAESSNLLVPGYDSYYAPGSTDAFTIMGQTFRSQAGKYGTRNLAGDEAANVNLFVEKPNSKGEATLTATFRNNGTFSIVDPFSVTFYSDAALTQPIGTAVVEPPQSGAIMGCSWIEPPHSVSLTWSDLPVGVHSYWAKIDSGNVLAETNENDNVTTRGEVIVESRTEYAYQLFIPVSRED